MRKLVPARVSCPIFFFARFHVRLNRIKYQTRNRAKNRLTKVTGLQISIVQGDGTPESHKKLLPAVADPGKGRGGRPLIIRPN